jgi:internalin A
MTESYYPSPKDKHEIVDLSFSDLTEIPEEIYTYTNLKVLDLRSNKLTDLSPKISRLKNLKVLLLTGNQLTTLPPEIGELTKLERLNLSQNKLYNLPEEFGNLVQLQELYLSHNRLETLPNSFHDFKNLTRLTISNNQFFAFPLEISQLTHIQWLDLSDNKLEFISEEMGNLTQLIDLNLSRNQIKEFPAILGTLKRLKELDLSFNNLGEIPETIQHLTELRSLYLHKNKLKNLPEQIGYLKELNTLDIYENNLQSLPRAIGELTKLAALRVHKNNLTSLPAEIGSLSQLQELNLGNNPLTDFPSEFCQLVEFSKKLSFLDLRDTYLPIPPEVIFKKNEPRKLIEHYSKSSQSSQPLNEAKIFLVGESNVGKTSLMRQVKYNVYNESQDMTPGINTYSWEIDLRKEDCESSKIIKMNIWDFGGQEIYHATHQFFLTTRSLYLLVLDNRNNEQQNRISYWLKVIETFAGDSPVIMVGNKLDEFTLDINEEFYKKKYPNLRTIIKTSCRNGEGIEELRELIKQEIDSLSHVKTPLRTTWANVKKILEIEKEQKKLNYISYEDYQQICYNNNVISEAEQKELIHFMHDLGVVLYFQDEQDNYSLDDTAVFNPLWITNGIYKILNDNSLMDTFKGKVPEERLLETVYLNDEIDYPRQKSQFIIEMMRKFDLCYRIDSPDNYEVEYLIPSLLPKNQPPLGRWP